MKTPFFSLTIFLILIFGLSVNLSASAEIPNAAGAKQFATSFFKKNAPKFLPGKTIQSPVLQQRYQSASFKQTPVFVFQNSDKGFAVVAQRNNNFAVVGYSPVGLFEADSMPAQLKVLLKLYEDSLQIKPSAPQKTAAGTPVAIPLLDEAGIYLNQFGHENVGNCPTGCVATAFAQIMAYYKFPERGIGSHCYNHTTYGQLCADFGNTTYNWQNPTDENYRLLSYHVGVAMDMNYCGSSNGSAPYSWGYEKAMNTYFKYYLNNGSKESYYIRNEIDHRRPVYAELPGMPGHAVVLDGYDTDGLFHINFGWGGQYNGYYVLNSNSTFFVGYKFGTNISAAVFLSPRPLKTNTQDSLALVTVHNAFNAATGWDLKQPVSTWSNVVVMNERVIGLSLNFGGNITNKCIIPPEIGNLTALQSLTIAGQIDGELPTTITNLTELKYLYIYGGSGTLKVTLPANIGNLTKLETLYVPIHADGSIPTSIGNLKNLTRLELNSGNLTGIIPATIGELINLKTLDLSKNKLTGSIPSVFANLTNLTEVYLAENQLSGALPDNIGNLKELTILTLNDNKLSGNLPGSLGNCTKLTRFNVYNNQFTGEIPTSLANLSQIKALNFSNNKFSSLPAETDKWANLEELDVSNNLLTSLPGTINLLTNLKSLLAANNKISTLPENFGFLPSLRAIDLSFNNLTEFPDALCQLTRLESVNFRKNKIKEFPPSINLMAPTVSSLVLDSNEISGKLPKELLENGKISPLLLGWNRFTFEDIPVSGKLKSQIYNQKPVKLTRKVFNVAIGDTINIDIRKIATFTLTTNQYNWISAIKNKAVSDTPNPVLTVIIDEKTINNKYYCQVTNPQAPTYSFTDYGNTYTFPCLNSVTTDTLSFQAATEEVLISEKYDGGYVVSTKNIPSKIVEDRLVTLVPPLRVRGTITWQASADGKTWYDLTSTMQQADLKANFVTVKQQELVLSPKTPAFYRCNVQDVNCEPLYSDTIRVNPFGKVLYDGTLNAATETRTIRTDSIEVTLPAGIYDKDFRLTIVKLDNPPAAPAGMKMSSAYDVTVSFGSIFDKALHIKLKNIDKKIISNKELPAIKPGYYDEITREWVIYDNGGIMLKDSSVYFLTSHLTKLAWFELAHGSFTHIHTGERVNVIYKWGTNTGEENNYLGYEYTNKKKAQEPWYNSNTDPDKNGTPLIVQDIAGYMDIIIKKFKEKGLETPSLRFNVYVSNLGMQAFGKIGLCGYLAGRGYFEINSALAIDRDDLRKTLAHEFMHYTQDYYMVVLTDNYFFTEAHAPTAARIVWPFDSELETAEPEDNLKMALTEKTENGTVMRSIFDLLSEPWDNAGTAPVFEKFLVNTTEANFSSTFLHYMQCCRKGTPFNLAGLLTNHGWGSSATNWTWRAYINSQVSAQIGTTIGDEYDDFVRYLLTGANEKFTLLNTGDGNPYTYIIKNLTPENEGTFAKRLVYNFAKEDQNPQKEDIEIKVPYLASKVLMLYNQTPDRAVVVHYKRLHTIDKENKVYYGKFDFKTKQTTFVDITDSLNYNIFIEARSDKSVKESQNIGFLLLVNKKCPAMVSWSNDFSASFELTAMPVFDIEYVYTGWIAGADGNSLYVHTNSKGNKDAFLVSGVHLNFTSPNVVSHVVNYYSSSRSMATDSSYVVNIDFGDEQRSEYPDIGAFPGIQISDKQIKIEYNFVKSTMKLTSNAKFTNKYETIYEEKPRIILGSIWYDDTKLWLKDINTMTVSALGEYLLLRTNNSSETLAVVEKMSSSHKEIRYNSTTGEPYPEETTHYVNTDYSGGDVVLKLLFKTR